VSRTLIGALGFVAYVAFIEALFRRLGGATRTLSG
jgi:hypothetical protein